MFDETRISGAKAKNRVMAISVCERRTRSAVSERFSGVMAGQQPVEDGRERPYVPAIHVLLPEHRKKDVDAREDGVPAA
jgi:hypothetical protein